MAQFNICNINAANEFLSNLKRSSEFSEFKNMFGRKRNVLEWRLCLSQDERQ